MLVSERNKTNSQVKDTNENPKQMEFQHSPRENTNYCVQQLNTSAEWEREKGTHGFSCGIYPTGNTQYIAKQMNEHGKHGMLQRFRMDILMYLYSSVSIIPVYCWCSLSENVCIDLFHHIASHTNNLRERKYTCPCELRRIWCVCVCTARINNKRSRD